MEQKNRKIREWFKNHKQAFFLIVILMFLTMITSFYYFSEKKICIIDEEQKFLIKTREDTVSEILKQQNIVLKPKDQVQPSLNTKIKKDMKIVIQRAKPITIIVDGKKERIFTPKAKVEDILKEAKIVLGEKDRVQPKRDAKIEKEEKIQVVRVIEKNIVEEQPIPYLTKEQPTEKLDVGDTKVVQQGKNGVKENHIKVIYENGKEIKRELLHEKIVIEPKNEVIQVGMNDAVDISRGNTRFKKAMMVTATAYCPSDPGVNGVTSVGARLQKGVIAVDPKVIPYHTKIYVPGYGFGQALDTGGAIKGNHIDLAMDSKKEALEYGRKQVKIYLLD
ncbi:ubiquitin-like domain-containing protein [Garciella nitratireducens]|uniref:ubiquitin-like domain-containing protein n=1 Tax=Garciella nitratireducens TaxID=218205 RepID=UPI001BD3603F|nr:ubiquitin-like domain-containing protein [Garciella nitratireducens]